MSVGAQGVVDAYHAVRARHGRLPSFLPFQVSYHARSRRREGEAEHGSVPRAERSGRPLGECLDEPAVGHMPSFTPGKDEEGRPSSAIRIVRVEAEARLRLLVPHALRRERSLAPGEVRARQGLQGQESFIRSARGHQIPPGHGAADLAAAAPVEARPVPEQRRAVTVPFSVYRVDGVLGG